MTTWRGRLVGVDHDAEVFRSEHQLIACLGDELTLLPLGDLAQIGVRSSITNKSTTQLPGLPFQLSTAVGNGNDGDASLSWPAFVLDVVVDLAHLCTLDVCGIALGAGWTECLQDAQARDGNVTG